MPAKLANVVRVRCLGPGKEHTFASRDPKRERVCRACRDKLDNMGASVRDRPLPVRLDN